ncbi:hypothetical protein BV96_00871 [Sphingomonas paucimobilis]|nr:hypothetical protein BV96_00871 [Sphingomonas paucimobilis]
MYAVALTGSRFTEEGLVDDIGVRGLWMQLQTRAGTRRISCEAAAPRWRDTDCLPRERFPLRIKVTLTNYHGVWLILNAADANGSTILPLERQLERLKHKSIRSAARTPIKEFKENFLVAFIPGLSLSLLALRRRRKIQASNRG